jgi:hypothetical protein
MARQSSFIKLEGTIGDVTFYKGANGSFARQKGGVSKSRILNDPKFQRTRENLAEFARAASSSQLLKNAFREIILRSKDLRTHNRLYALAMRVIKSDLVNARGERIFEEGDKSLIKGFQFNANAMWNSTVFAQYSVQDAVSEITVEFETFVPGSKISSPVGATHGRIFLITAALNVPDGIFETIAPGNIIPVSRNTGEGKGSQSRHAFEKLKELIYSIIDQKEQVQLIQLHLFQRSSCSCYSSCFGFAMQNLPTSCRPILSGFVILKNHP